MSVLKMNERIKKFIEQQTSATVCCVDEQNKPYCFTVFYSFDKGDFYIYYKSSNDTKHAVLLKKNPIIAGTILTDKLNLLMIKGIQFEGVQIELDDAGTKKAAKLYYGRHPIARAVPGEIWVIRIDHIKFTDNSVGFGKKISWERE